ncbi:Ig-like domain-containing protein [Modestobacter sp. VKM Ac-2983]|uniref:Ig-like domain-containing protein n=1 Tax=Modestobacter sp. VKM Ac-2983 TaxID=3004137 RepID=UPI0022AB7959|nr:Ig-like domain-containing protein [Modestobacter sp. VKM Ac-2983]MCZ2803675.1 Ig-like domain-containing protein [Modestobacter sp. VKM Ac-2983]
MPALALGLLAAVLVAPPVAAAQPVLGEGDPLQAGEYVVVVDSPELTELARAHGVRVEESTTGPLNSLTAQLTARQAQALAADPRVVAISPNVTFTGNAQVLPPAVQRVDADEPPVSAGSPTAPVPAGGIAIIDTGIEAHPDYTIGGGADCIGAGTTTDDNGHGTGVAGAAAAISNDRGLVGSAPGATLYAVKVLDSKLKGTLSDIACGLNWVAANADALDIRVVNLSLGTPGTDSGDCGVAAGDVLHQAICAVVDAGVVPVAAAGNQAADLATQVPASYDEVLAVTNVADYDGRPGGLAGTPPCATSNADDTPAVKTNYAVTAADAAHTVAAPGECPYTTKKGNRYGYIASGSSMSAAIASGVVLDCMQAGRACAGQSPAQVIETLIASAAAVSDTHGYVGDPTSRTGQQYWGYMLTTRFDGDAPPPPPIGTGDTTAPAVQLLAPADGAVVSGLATFRASASDDVGVTAVDFYSGTTLLGTASPVDGGVWEFVYDTTGTPDGNYPVVARARDAAGNVGSSSSVTITLQQSSTAPPGSTDTTAPAVQVVAPTSGSVVSGSVVLRASASDAVGVTAVRFYSGSSLLGSATQVGDAWEFVYDTTGTPDGNYPVVARAYDAAGNVGSSSSVTITLQQSSTAPPGSTDTTAPAVQVVAPTSGSVVSGSVVLRASASDAVGVTAVRFYSGSSLLGSATQVGDAWEFVYDTTRTRNGTYPVVARAYDAAGNTGTAAPIDLTVQN